MDFYMPNFRKYESDKKNLYQHSAKETYTVDLRIFDHKKNLYLYPNNKTNDKLGNKYFFEENEDCFINGDLAMIKQSIRIFVQNAAKYSDKGNTIKLSVKNTGTNITYSVQDEGIGIAGEELGHIFERFYRADKARNSSTGGSGLGLSIAKWIVDAHKGSVEVLSRPEFGTRITVSLDAAAD